MSVTVELPSPTSPVPPSLPLFARRRRRSKRFSSSTAEGPLVVVTVAAAAVRNSGDAMLTDSTSPPVCASSTSRISGVSSSAFQATTRLTSLAARRESLRLNFQRSISEPSGQDIFTGVLPQSPVALETSASCSSNLHPSKRCKTMVMMQDGASSESPLPTPSRFPPSSSIASTPSSCSMALLPTSGPSSFNTHLNVNHSNNNNCLLLPPQPDNLALSGSLSLPTSPCGENFILQKTALVKNARTTDHSSLAAKLHAEAQNGDSEVAFSNCLLIDCRPFIAYNVSHIRGAINVNCCDRFNRKRLQRGKSTLADLAATKEAKELLKKRTWTEVVVYDDRSDNLQELQPSHTIFLVMDALLEDRREPIMLLGGFRDFKTAHEALCEDPPVIAFAESSCEHPSGTEVNGSAMFPHSHLPCHNVSLQEIGTELVINGTDDCGMSSLLPDLPSPSAICDTKDIENHPATQVLPHLFLGNMRDASDASVLNRLGVRYVLNVTSMPPVYKAEPGIRYKQLVAADNGSQNIRQFFDEAFEFIDLAKNNRSGVLIHCQAGISRSPTIAVAYLMKRYPMAMSEAYKFVKTKRSIISPNLNFMGQLWEFEQGLGTNNHGDGIRGNSDLSRDIRKGKTTRIDTAGELAQTGPSTVVSMASSETKISESNL